MIIVEGPDNSGKTTLAQRISLATGFEYRRPPTLSSTEGPDGGVFDWWEDQLSLPPREHLTAVYDRCTYISDPIYRLVSGRPPLRNEQEMTNGLHQLFGVNPLIIFCLPSWEWSTRHHEEEHKAGLGLSYANIDQLRVIHWAYRLNYTLWSEAFFENVWSWDPENGSWDAFVSTTLTDWLNHVARRLRNG